MISRLRLIDDGDRPEVGRRCKSKLLSLLELPNSIPARCPDSQALANRVGMEKAAAEAARSHIIHHTSPGVAPTLATVNEALRIGNETLARSQQDGSLQNGTDHPQLLAALAQVEALQARVADMEKADTGGGGRRQKRKPK